MQQVHGQAFTSLFRLVVCKPPGRAHVSVLLTQRARRCLGDFAVWKGLERYERQSIPTVSYYILSYLIHVCIMLLWISYTCWFNVYFICWGGARPKTPLFQAAPGGHHGFIRIHEVGEGGQCGQCGQVVSLDSGAQQSPQRSCCHSANSLYNSIQLLSI